MNLDVVFVGTAASVPSGARGVSSVLVRRGGERMLIDCGEGTQRQLMRSVGLADIDLLLLTHLHADHVLGIPGMLKTFALRDRDQPLRLIGPAGTRRLWSTFQPLIGRLSYEVDVEEIDAGTAVRGDGYEWDAIPTEHGVASVGWRLTEADRPGRFDVERARELGVTPGADFGVLQRGGEVTTSGGTVVRSSDVVGESRSGRTIIYTGDTRACAAVRNAARHASVLIHEATFTSDDADRAAETHHATAQDAALTAAAANVQLLALTHVSTRYRPRDLRDEARAVFPNTIVARDFDIIDLPFPERGEPTHLPRAARESQHSDAPVTEPCTTPR